MSQTTTRLEPIPLTFSIATNGYWVADLVN